MPTPNSKSSEPIPVWYVCFCTADVRFKGIRGLFQRGPYGHVYLFSEAGPFIQFVHPRSTNVSLEINYSPIPDVPLEGLDIAREMHSQGHTVLIFKHRPKSISWITTLVPSCVTVAKVVLGINCMATTPRQLAKYLVKKGAILYTPELNDVEDIMEFD